MEKWRSKIVEGCLANGKIKVSFFANAMINANEALRSNPKKPTTLTYEINSNGDEESIEATQIGKGAFATAYLGVDGMVYLVVVDGTDPSKGMLVDINRYGAQPHIPIVEWVGWTTVRRKGRYEDATVYRSPLYKAPLRKSDSAIAWTMKKELDKALEYSNDQMSWKERTSCWYTPKLRQGVSDYLQDAKKPKGITKKKWETFVESVDELAKEGGNYGEMQFEFPARNLATDAKGQLILLDVLFDKEALVKQRGGRC